jgi:hypothetical protein
MAFGAALVVITSAASASDPVAEALFQEGLALYEAQRFDESCRVLASSFARERKSGTLVVLASCHERLGRIATAWAEYKEAATLARADGRPHHAEKALALAAALEPLLPKVTVRVAEPDVALAIDGTTILPDIELPLDPGEHRLRAGAPGKTAFETSFQIEARGRVTLEVPRLEAAPVSSPKERDAPSPARARARPPATRPSRSSSSSPPAPMWPWPVGAGGVVLVGVAAGMLAMSLDAGSTLDARCGAARASCPRAYAFSEDRTRELAGFGLFIGLGLSGAGATTAAIVGLTVPAE